MKEKDINRILAGIILILLLALFVFFIYSRTYKAEVLEAYNQGQRDMGGNLTTIINLKAEEEFNAYFPKFFPVSLIKGNESQEVSLGIAELCAVYNKLVGIVR